MPAVKQNNRNILVAIFKNNPIVDDRQVLEKWKKIVMFDIVQFIEKGQIAFNDDVQITYNSVYGDCIYSG